MHCNNLGLALGLWLVKVSSRVMVRIRVKVRVSIMVRVSIRTNWVVNFALFRCYRPVIYTRPIKLVSWSLTSLFSTNMAISETSPIKELRTLRTQDTSDPGHFGTSLEGPNCPDRSALVPKCPKDSLDLSAELSCPKCRTVPSQVPSVLTPF